MLSKKKVLIDGHSPLQKWDGVGVPWADVWISFKGGRKKKYYAPCLCSRFNLLQDMDIDRSIVQEDLETPNNKPKMSKSVVQEFKDELVRSQKMLDRLDSEGVIIDDGNKDLVEKSIEEIYSSQDAIDRAEAEKMILTYMKYLGYDPDNIKLKWVKCKEVAWPA